MPRRNGETDYVGGFGSVGKLNFHVVALAMPGLALASNGIGSRLLARDDVEEPVLARWPITVAVKELEVVEAENMSRAQ
eukprot:COSAG01_NODE_2272_length_8023_cov_2.962140_9_plen_78_part_01